MLRFFERLDTLEERVLQLEIERDELATLLCVYIENEIVTPISRRSAEQLAAGLRARQASRAASKRK
jgi:hypothetical protein